MQRCGVAATWANVVVDEHHDHEHRPASQIRKLLDAADLHDGVRRRAQAVFDTLAAAEGAVHGIDPDDVEFHEVGAVDAIVDVVGIAAALEALAIDELVAGPVATGRGTITAAHGSLPNPAPAVARLLASRQDAGDRRRHRPRAGDTDGCRRPRRPGDVVRGAAGDDRVVGRLRRRPRRHRRTAQRRAGDRRRGAATAGAVAPRPGRAAVQVDVNVDDVTGEVIAHTIAALVAAGAFDAWATPIVMKKGRPAHVVSALCDPALVEAVAAVLVAETGSLGVRATTVERWPQARRESSVDVGGHRIGVKLAAGRVKVEHDDAASGCAGARPSAARRARRGRSAAAPKSATTARPRLP